MGAERWFGSRGCARSAVAVMLFAAGCLSPPPSRESAPEAPKTPAAPEPAPLESTTPAPEPPPPPAAAPAAEGAAAPLRQAPQQVVEPRPARSAKPEAPATKARSRSAADDARAEREVGSGGATGPAELREELDREERAAAPDCSAARERTKAICDLAGQICRLTDRDPNVASVAEYCADAKQRCGAAARRTAERCPD